MDMELLLHSISIFFKYPYLVQYQFKQHNCFFPGFKLEKLGKRNFKKMLRNTQLERQLDGIGITTDMGALDPLFTNLMIVKISKLC